ncbi:MAG TPA: hypothetical protein VGR16_12710 [Thermomicrobiales bacterium]|nr:hypothetical protein [Thermomicrobiales bacterium]
MNRTITVIWSTLLVVTAVGVVPVVVGLLQRALTAAQSIERYTAEALASGGGIAQETASAAKLKETIDIAGQLLSGAASIERHTASVEAALGGREAAADGEVRA